MMTRGLIATLLLLASASCTFALEHHHRHHHKHSLRTPKLPWMKDNSTKAQQDPSAVPAEAVAVPDATVEDHAVVLNAAAAEATAAKAKKAAFVKAMKKGKQEAKLKDLASKCSCEFHDVCDCDATLKFMHCITEACSSARCDCPDKQYHASCLDIALTCPSLEFKCSEENVVCRESTDETPIEDLPTDVVQKDLEHALKKRCTYLSAEKKGYVNADNARENLEPLIKKYQDTLTERGEKVPTHTCKDEPKPAPKPEPNAFWKEKVFCPDRLKMGNDPCEKGGAASTQVTLLTALFGAFALFFH